MVLKAGSLDPKDYQMVDPTAWVDAYLKALYPPGTQHVSDEDIAAALDKSDKHSKAAHKAQERKRQQRAEASRAESEKRA